MQTPVLCPEVLGTENISQVIVAHYSPGGRGGGSSINLWNFDSLLSPCPRSYGLAVDILPDMVPR